MKRVRVLDLFLSNPVHRIIVDVHVGDSEEKAGYPVSNEKYNCEKLDQVHNNSN
jgi:hypothetical protein